MVTKSNKSDVNSISFDEVKKLTEYIEKDFDNNFTNTDKISDLDIKDFVASSALAFATRGFTRKMNVMLMDYGDRPEEFVSKTKLLLIKLEKMQEYYEDHLIIPF